MAREREWSELRGGMIASLAIVGVVLLTLLFARVGALHGKKVTLYVVTDDATGVLPGTEVWLGGKKEGLVKSVSFRPPSTDTTERVIITTDFLTEGFSNVRRDSYAEIRPGGSLIGAVIVNISPGTSASRPLHDRDTVHTRAMASIANLSEDVGTIAPEVSALASEVKQLTSKISGSGGTIGNFRAHGLASVTDLSAGMSLHPKLQTETAQLVLPCAPISRAGLRARWLALIRFAPCSRRIKGASAGFSATLRLSPKPRA
jgi:ABC-type transporter Mla subunit MlaD